MTDILKLSGLSEDDVKEGFDNTVKIADTIETYDFRHTTIVPKIHIPEFKCSQILYSFCEQNNYPMIKKF